MNLEQRMAALIEARDALKTLVDKVGAQLSLSSTKACHDKLEEHRQLNDEFADGAARNQPAASLNRIGAAREAIPRNLIEHLYGSYVLLDEVENGRSDADLLWVLQDSARALTKAME